LRRENIGQKTLSGSHYGLHSSKIAHRLLIEAPALNYITVLRSSSTVLQMASHTPSDITPAWTYQPINGDEVRLIKINTDRSDEGHISCTLQYFELDEHLTFNALSYVWGDPKLPRGSEVSCLYTSSGPPSALRWTLLSIKSDGSHKPIPPIALHLLRALYRNSTRRLIPPSSAAVKGLPPTAIIKRIACISPAGRVRRSDRLSRAYGSCVELSVAPPSGASTTSKDTPFPRICRRPKVKTRSFRLDAGS
jgi:hypothetical protein